MNTLPIGQCLTSFNNEYVVSSVHLENEKISYTILGMNHPTSTVLLESSLRFYQVTEKKLSLDDLRARRQFVQHVIEQREERIQAEEEARELEKIQVMADPKNEGLLTTEKESNTTKLAAKNIRLLLKKHFPTVKFSVRMRDYNAIYVSWTDGATKSAVEEVISHFQEGSFNGMEDIYEYDNRSFNKVYGGVQYLFCDRSYSDVLITEAIDKIRCRFGENAVPSDVTAEDYRKGMLWNRNLECFPNGIQAQINKQMSEIDKSKS